MPEEKDNKQEISNLEIDKSPSNSPSVQNIVNTIMRIKNYFLQEFLLCLLFIIGAQAIPDGLYFVDFLANCFLLKELKDEVEFQERIQRGEVTPQELIEFYVNTRCSIHCLSCFREIKKEDKVIECSSCELAFHENCFKKENNPGDKCYFCINN